MPTYEYRCADCEHRMEVFASMSDPPPEACEQCGGAELSKVLFPVAVHYKGSGFYSTDYAGKRQGGADASRSTDAADGGSGTDTSKSDSSSASGKSEGGSGSGTSDGGSGSGTGTSGGSSGSAAGD